MKSTIRTVAILLAFASVPTISYSGETPAGETAGGGVLMSRSFSLVMTTIEVVNENGEAVLVTTADDDDAIEALPAGSYTLNYLSGNDIVATVTLEK